MLFRLGVILVALFGLTGPIDLALGAEGFCADCGQAGWVKLKETCGKSITNEDGAVACFAKFPWFQFDRNKNRSEVKSGHIVMGRHGVLPTATKESIRVFVFRRHAIDEAGNIYLDGELG